MTTVAQFPVFQEMRLPEGTADLCGRRNGTMLGWIRGDRGGRDVSGVNYSDGRVSNANRTDEHF